MKKFRFLFSLLALLVGGGIVAVSLYSASVSQAYDDQQATNRKFYISKEILPDNTFYPVLALIDRTRLEMALPVDRIYLQTEYSQQRLDYAKQLVLQDNLAIAQSTLTKSQKYLNLAAQEAITNKASKEVKLHIIASIDYHLAEIPTLIDSLSNEDKQVVEALKNETKALQEVLIRDLEN